MKCETDQHIYLRYLNRRIHFIVLSCHTERNYLIQRKPAKVKRYTSLLLPVITGSNAGQNQICHIINMPIPIFFKSLLHNSVPFYRSSENKVVIVGQELKATERMCIFKENDLQILKLCIASGMFIKIQPFLKSRMDNKKIECHTFMPF